MPRESDDLCCGPVPRPVLSSTLDRVDDGLEESFRIHRPLEPESGIGDVEHPVLIQKTARLFTRQSHSRLSTRHTLTPRSPTIRQPPIGKNDDIKCKLFNGLTNDIPNFFHEHRVANVTPFPFAQLAVGIVATGSTAFLEARE
jgi:hypothetical protein